MSEPVNCPEPKCPTYGQPMRVAHQNSYQRLWKCPTCGHMVLVNLKDGKTQEWKKDDVHG